ncbi:MAG: YHYH protein [Flavobacteriales bacterium]
MKRIYTALMAALLMHTAIAQGPEVTSWLINTDGSTGYNNIPSNVSSVYYTTTDVYVSATCIPDYDIGPWTGNPNTAQDQDLTFMLTRNPVENTGTDIATPLGHIGVWKNGVTLFNARDAASYNNLNIWHQNAIVVEGISFDDCMGHPNQNGEYHLHLNPVCLYDHTDGTQHSPLLGYAFDGFPIYGAWAYANNDGTGDIVRMQSSYQYRNITNRTTLSDGTILQANQYGPAINNQYPLGYFTEDFEYIQNLGHLDDHNGRFCITPEYPDGMYCYFTTINENFDAAFPYIIGYTYYGMVQAGNTGPGSGNNTVPGNATQYTPNAISETIYDAVQIATSDVQWTLLTDHSIAWQLHNTTSILVAEGDTQSIVHAQLTAGCYIISYRMEAQWYRVRVVKE